MVTHYKSVIYIRSNLEFYCNGFNSIHILQMYPYLLTIFWIRIESSQVHDPFLGTQLAREQFIASGGGDCTLPGCSKRNLA